MILLLCNDIYAALYNDVSKQNNKYHKKHQNNDKTYFLK